MTYNIVQKDCIEFLKGIPNDSVDLVLTDPPYAIGFDGGKGWDRQWKTEADYLAWCAEWSKECARVLKPGRMMIVWGTLKTDTFLRYKLDVLNQIEGMVGQNEVIWSYNWGGRSNKNFARKHEYAWCYSKGSDFLFNADAVRVPRKMTSNMRTGETHDKGTIPTLIWEKNNHTMSKDFVNWHPTTKNVSILERLILGYTNPGDTVLDIFMGSGSTAVACESTDRNSIGCETHPEYYDKLMDRLQKATTMKENLK